MEHQELLKLKPDKKIEGYSFSLQSVIGQGSSGTVYLGIKDETNIPVAIKVIDIRTLTNEYQWQLVNQEIDTMKKLQNPHIVKLLDVFQTQNNTYIITEYCNQGDLRQLLRKKKFVNENDGIKIIKQILLGVYELTKHGIIHRDIKPANIMIHDGIMKLTDFGFARKIDDHQQMMNSLVGTPLYMSPQILKRSQYSSKCDIWSIGIIMYELLLGETPWPANTMLELINLIHQKPIQFQVQQNKISNDLIAFIKGCLAIEEKDRFTWDQVYKHNLFNLEATYLQWQQMLKQQQLSKQNSEQPVNQCQEQLKQRFSLDPNLMNQQQKQQITSLQQQYSQKLQIQQKQQVIPVNQQQSSQPFHRQSPKHNTQPPMQQQNPNFVPIQFQPIQNSSNQNSNQGQLPAPPLNQMDFPQPQPRHKATTAYSPPHSQASQMSIENQQSPSTKNLQVNRNPLHEYNLQQSPRYPQNFRLQQYQSNQYTTSNKQNESESMVTESPVVQPENENPSTPQQTPNNKKTIEQYQKSLMKNYLRGEYLNNEKIIQNQLNFVAYLRQIRNLIEIHCRYCIEVSWGKIILMLLILGLYDKILFLVVKHAFYHISVIKSEMVEKYNNLLNLNEWQTFCRSETYQKCCAQIVNTYVEIFGILQSYLLKTDYLEDGVFFDTFNSETIDYQGFLKIANLYTNQILRELNHKVCLRVKSTMNIENMTLLSRDDQLVVETLYNLVKYKSNLLQSINKDVESYIQQINESDFLEGPYLVLDIEQYNSLRRKIFQLEINNQI